jgi:hypothetical protein
MKKFSNRKAAAIKLAAMTENDFMQWASHTQKDIADLLATLTEEDRQFSGWQEMAMKNERLLIVLSVFDKEYMDGYVSAAPFDAKFRDHM